MVQIQPKNNLFNTIRNILKPIKSAATVPTIASVDVVKLPVFTKIADTLHPTAIQQLQDNLHDTLSAITTKPQLSSNLLQEIYLPRNTMVEIEHGLGRPIVGWHMTHSDQMTQLFSLQDQNTHPEKTLMVKSTANATVHLLVF